MPKKTSKNNKLEAEKKHFSNDDLEIWQSYSKNLDPLSKKARLKQKAYGKPNNGANKALDAPKEVINQDENELDFEDLLGEYVTENFGNTETNTEKKRKNTEKKGEKQGEKTGKKGIKTTKNQASSFSKPNSSSNTKIPTPNNQKPYIKSHNNISQKEIERRNYQKLKKGLINLDGVIDLHGLRANEAYSSLLSFIINSQQRGHRYILAITGKGNSKSRNSQSYWYEEADIGVLKRSLPGWISDQQFKPYVIGCSQAHKKDGGEGAFYLHIRNINKMR